MPWPNEGPHVERPLKEPVGMPSMVKFSGSATERHDGPLAGARFFFDLLDAERRFCRPRLFLPKSVHARSRFDTLAARWSRHAGIVLLAHT